MSTTITRLLGGLVTTTLAGGLATIAIVASTDTVSLQDIADMSGTRTAGENRWLAHVVSVPNGSVHTMVSANDTGFSLQETTVSLGVQTAEALHVLDRDRNQKTGNRPTINRGLKGNRVVEPPKVAKAAVHPHALIATDSLITGSLTAAHANPLLKTALTFRQSMPSPAEPEKKPQDLKSVVDAEIAGSKGRVKIAQGQMKQARAAAKLMASVLEKTRKNEIGAKGEINPANVVSAYAPAVSEQVTEMASAFAAVIRPSNSKKAGRNKIRLGKGDHKWAANPLPRKSYSRSQRRCLATGIYFEARGEPIKGQKAVAQVILNRVKNPAYPNSICGVVYQNKWMYNSCQFSFACDGIRDRVKSPKHWRTATKIANDAIDGRFWLRSVGSSSHYHADYVWPKWRRSMRKMTKIGRHIFYRTYGGGWS